ncbi:MAG: hypothetical protein N2438_13145 [Limisphaera sp.]|nr:hypothetical protein [Limisphaera sp.]
MNEDRRKEFETSAGSAVPEPADAAALRRLSAEQLEALGQTSLREHLRAQAVVAHARYAPLTAENLPRFLRDPDCVRYPVRLVFEFGEMAAHQFAEPGMDFRDPTGQGRVLYLRPCLRERPEWVVLAVAYMIPVINYGPVITDEHCLLYGATLLGLMEEEFYRRVCEMADGCGVEARWPEQPGCGAGGTFRGSMR